MLWYILKMLALLPLLAFLIWATLWFSKRLQTRLHGAQQPRMAQLVETSMIAPGMRLAVIEFGGKAVLLGSSRHGLTRLSEVPLTEAKTAIENHTGEVAP